MVSRPPRLKPGDLIAIVAPSNQVATCQEDLLQGARCLEALGFRTRMGRTCFLQDGPLAGSAEERLRDLHSAWADPDVRAIVAATGGFGCAALVDRLDYDLVRRNPKVFMGMSDISILLVAIHARTGLVTFHGTHVLEGFATEDAQLEAPHFLAVTGRAAPAGPLPDWAGPVRVQRDDAHRLRRLRGRVGVPHRGPGGVLTLPAAG